VNLTESTVTDITKNTKLTSGKIPKVMVDILNEGGLIPYIEKHHDFEI
jgi:hypothetical protein